MPEGIVGRIGNPCIESNLCQIPTRSVTDSFGQGRDIVVWVRVAERFPNGVKQVLTVYEGDGTLDGWFRWHCDLQNK